MPRKRMLDPNFWRDEKISKCTYMERLLFQGLWTFAEDSGVGRANPLLIKADVFPYDTLREADIERSLAKLSGLGLIKLYEVDGQRYYFVVNFKKHQTINRPTPGTLPLPDEGITEDSVSTHGGLTPEEKLNKSKKTESKDAHTRAEDMLSEYKFPADLSAKLREWLSYKRELGDKYTPTGLKTLFAKVEDRLKAHGQGEIISLIDLSMSNGWKGIIWEKLERPQKSSGMLERDESLEEIRAKIEDPIIRIMAEMEKQAQP